jgi:hypothetical protein
MKIELSFDEADNVSHALARARERLEDGIIRVRSMRGVLMASKVASIEELKRQVATLDALAKRIDVAYTAAKVEGAR